MEFCRCLGEGGEHGLHERMLGAGGNEGVDIALGCGAVDGAQGGVFEGVGQELAGEGDGQPAGDEGANGD